MTLKLLRRTNSHQKEEGCLSEAKTSALGDAFPSVRLLLTSWREFYFGTGWTVRHSSPVWSRSAVVRRGNNFRLGSPRRIAWTEYLDIGLHRLSCNDKPGVLREPYYIAVAMKPISGQAIHTLCFNNSCGRGCGDGEILDLSLKVTPSNSSTSNAALGVL